MKIASKRERKREREKMKERERERGETEGDRVRDAEGGGEWRMYNGTDCPQIGVCSSYRWAIQSETESGL